MLLASRIGLAGVLCAVVVGSLGACGKVARDGGVDGRTVTGMRSRANEPAFHGFVSSDVVAQVGTHAITKQTLEHWVTVQAALAYEYRPGQPAPRGLVPDPPRFAACISRLAGPAGSQLRRTQLKAQCRQQLEGLQRQALESLIMNRWISEEATRWGVSVSPQKVMFTVEQKYSAPAARRFFSAAGVRITDERSIVRSQFLLLGVQHRTMSSSLLAKIQPGAPTESRQTAEQVDAHIQKLSEAIARRWRPATHCRGGYVVPSCSEHKAT